MFFVGRATMSDTLLRVAELAQDAIPAAEFVGLTMLDKDKPTTAVFTDERSPEIDQAQYQSGHGPCLEAFRTGEIRMIRSTRHDTIWPDFSAACLANGILSTLSLPMALHDERLGAMNMYSTQEAPFDGEAIETAVLYAAQASIVLANAQAYWDARSIGDQLSESIQSRAVIEQAKGIIMGSMRCSAEQAFAYLLQQSQHTNLKLRIVAEHIVADVSRRRGEDPLGGRLDANEGSA
jgi:GAF domain-containing protein